METIGISVGIIGAGRMGLAMARALVRAGYAVRLGSRDPGRLTGKMRDRSITAASWQEAADRSGIILLALLWQDTNDLAALAPALAGKVVITCTNHETGGGLPAGLAVLPGSSAAETISAALPGARVVAAFNHVYAELLDRESRFDGGTPTVFVAADDPAAKADAMHLIEHLRLDPVDAGPLAHARLLEAMAEMMVHLVRVRGFGPEGVALRLMYRAEE
jgi:predicted dinucleotide-binding enzyme